MADIKNGQNKGENTGTRQHPTHGGRKQPNVAPLLGRHPPKKTEQRREPVERTQEGPVPHAGGNSPSPSPNGEI